MTAIDKRRGKFCKQALQVESVVETVRTLDFELRKHCMENQVEKDKDEMDKRQISASFLEVGQSICNPSKVCSCSR